MATRFMDDMITSMTDGRLCPTSTGYIGQAPCDVQDGDVVGIVAGATTPFVLRSPGNGLRLLSPCYIHGIMKGEA